MSALDPATHAVVFWDGALGPPDLDGLELRDDEVVHAGLRLGLRAQPPLIDYVQPTWMLNADPSSSIRAASWRLSLRACVIATNVLRQLGGVLDGFHSLDAASLELGHRYITSGAFVWHDPRLGVPGGDVAAEIDLHDQVLFMSARFGAFWARWALFRAARANEVRIGEALAVARTIETPPASRARLQRRRRAATPSTHALVSVVIPTLDRYPYLRRLLPQLATQTHPVHEILVIDQTAEADLDPDLELDHAQLPLRVLRQSVPGQCTARNAAVRQATGTHILFLDDDVEIATTLVAQHMQSLAEHDADVCCGIVEEPDVPLPPVEERYVRTSDVFPTGNSMVRREVLERSGLFDLAYDRKMCEDGDLGTRLYLAGARMVLDATISLFHHRAPRGGLRAHAARRITYASSRHQITHRNLPHASQVYLAKRYFNAKQVREMLVLSTWGTLRARGSLLRQGAKLAFGLGVLPDTKQKIDNACREANAMLSEFPRIETLR
jgi:glycosyltransferase involved in cell wall biosynthesis